MLKDCCKIEDNTVLAPETVVPPFTVFSGSPGTVCAYVCLFICTCNCVPYSLVLNLQHKLFFFFELCKTQYLFHKLELPF